MARVAVVVPCFNSGGTIGETLASVRGQPCELVVVDDGSTDPRTLEALAAAEADGVRVLRQDNAGPAAARMTGVGATSAPYIFPLDADDQLADGALDALADALDASPEARFAWGDVGAVGEEGYVARIPLQLDPWLITYVNQLPVLSLVRRDALVDVGGWKPGVRHEDWDLWMSFAERGWRGVRVERIVAYYRFTYGGRWAADRSRYADAVATLRANHPALFAARAANRRRSTAPLRVRLVLPLVDRLGFLSPYDKRRVAEIVLRPGFTLGRLARRVRSR
jgi:glycosyltransferase involved in cell wall biosynthesis